MIAEMRGIVLSCVLATLGCHATAAEEARDVCTVLCRCASTIGQAACVDDCTAAIHATDDCVTCVFDNETTCATVNAECRPMCFQQPPPQGRSLP